MIMRMFLEADGLGRGSSPYTYEDEQAAMANGHNPFFDENGKERDYAGYVESCKKAGIKPQPEMYWAPAKNVAKASAAGEAQFDRFKPASEMRNDSLAADSDKLETVVQRDYLSNAYGKTDDPELKKQMAEMLNRIDDKLSDNTPIQKPTNVEASPKKEIEDQWFKDLQNKSNTVDDYYTNNIANSWDNLGEKDRKILLFDQLGTTLKNNLQYRPRLYGAFGNVVDEGREAGNEKSMLDNFLSNSLKNGMDRRNTRQKTAMENALKNIQSEADLKIALQKGINEGWLTRHNIQEFIKMVPNLDKRTLDSYISIMRSMGPHTYGVNVGPVGLSTTTPGVGIPSGN